MTLNITEDQKKVIESQGYMVVEFKLWCRELGKMILEYAEIVIDTWRAIILFLQEQAIKAFKHIKDFIEQISNELASYVKQLEYADREKDKYPFVRSIGRTYGANVSRKVVYHRCRDRC
ncbi:MAG: hypothetical protein KHW88_03690 [Lachnospiraceae bacterium]|nr:hypothetical protein [Lachnospiraceae bacterium]